MDEYANALLSAIKVALPSWVERTVDEVATRNGVALSDPLTEEARQAGAAALDDALPKLTALLSADVDEQSTTPLEILRSTTRFPTAVLQQRDVPVAQRDDFVARRFPHDLYDLTPTNYGDIDPALVEPALAWGAAKAMAHMARHRDSGSRS